METDKHYLRVGAFVLLTVLALATFSVWLEGAYNSSQYRTYRIRFDESVSGLNIGGPVKFRGVQVGKVQTMSIDPDDMRMIRVDISILKDTPIKSDTVATMKFQGITGGIFIELSGSTSEAEDLAYSKTGPAIIPSAPSTLNTVMDMLPKILDKISHITDQADKLLSNKNIAKVSHTLGNMQKASQNANEVTDEIKSNPTKLLFPPKNKDRGE